MASRLSLAELPDPPAASTPKPEPATIRVASSTTIFPRTAHLLAASRGETIAAAELLQLRVRMTCEGCAWSVKSFRGDAIMLDQPSVRMKVSRQWRSRELEANRSL